MTLCADCSQPARLCECDVIRALTSAPGEFVPAGLKPIECSVPRTVRDAQLRGALVDLAEYREGRASRRGVELNTHHTYGGWRGKSPRRAR